MALTVYRIAIAGSGRHTPGLLSQAPRNLDAERQTAEGLMGDKRESDELEHQVAALYRQMNYRVSEQGRSCRVVAS